MNDSLRGQPVTASACSKTRCVTKCRRNVTVRDRLTRACLQLKQVKCGFKVGWKLIRLYRSMRILCPQIQVLATLRQPDSETGYNAVISYHTHPLAHCGAVCCSLKINIYKPIVVGALPIHTSSIPISETKSLQCSEYKYSSGSGAVSNCDNSLYRQNRIPPLPYQGDFPAV